MTEDGLPRRAAFRDRHGRGIRRPLLSKLYQHGESDQSGFNQTVRATCEFLRAAWPVELAALQWQVLDAPAINDDSTTIRRWATKKSTMTIYIYRVPIERFGQHRRVSPLHERIRIEEYVFTAVAHLLDKEPWELVPENYRPEWF